MIERGAEITPHCIAGLDARDLRSGVTVILNGWAAGSPIIRDRLADAVRAGHSREI